VLGSKIFKPELNGFEIINLRLEYYRYVRVEYHAASSIPEAEALLRRKGNEFIEGIAFGKHNSVVMFGNFVDKAESGKVSKMPFPIVILITFS